MQMDETNPKIGGGGGVEAGDTPSIFRNHINTFFRANVESNEASYVVVLKFIIQIDHRLMFYSL